jgi:uncharacterized surface protein with fasciclin (FAS1) repeats
MNSILDTVVDMKELGMFCTAIKIVRIARTLHSAGPFTVFAPTDRAFTQLSSMKLQQLIADVSLLTKIMHNHIVAGDFTYQNLLKMCKEGERGITLTSIDGSPLYIDLADGIRIDKSTVIVTDILAENGIIHAIDRLIMPHISEQPKKTGWMSEYSTR